MAKNKKLPYLVDIEWEMEAQVLSFGKDETDAINNVDLSFSEISQFTDPDVYHRARLVRSLKDIPTDIVNGEWVDSGCIFGLDKGESLFDYFKEEAKKEAMKRLDEKNHHFPFWDEVKNGDNDEKNATSSNK